MISMVMLLLAQISDLLNDGFGLRYVLIDLIQVVIPFLLLRLLQ